MWLDGASGQQSVQLFEVLAIFSFGVFFFWFFLMAYDHSAILYTLCEVLLVHV